MEVCYANNSHSLFRKYRHLVTWFSNTDIGRDYLSQDNFCVPKEKIALLLPNGYHVWKDEKTIEATFTTRPFYSPKLYTALRAIDHIHQWIEDFDEAQRVLLGQLNLISYGRMPSAAKMLRFTTTIFNPDADPETTSVDGLARNVAGGTDFSTKVTGNGTSAADSGTQDNVPYINGANPASWTSLHRGFYLFDTSSITSANAVSAALFSLYVTFIVNTHSDSISLVASTVASNTAIVASDFQGTVGNTTKFATDLTIAGLATNAYNDWTVNAAGMAAIATSGITKYGTRLASDVANVGPAGANNETYALCQFAEGANKPKLTATYAVVASGDGSFLMSFA